VLGTAKFRNSLRAGQASYDVMAEFLKWLEAGEESIFSLDTEKNLPGASCELPEAAARAENPRNKIFPMSCRIPVWPFVVVVKAGLTTPAGNQYRRRDAAISSCYSTPRKLRRVAGR